MNIPSTPSPYDVLRAELQDLRLRSGNPPYERLAALVRSHPVPGSPVTVFSKGAIADNLNGNRRSMSSAFVRFFVAGCLMHARKSDITLPERDSDRQHWLELWKAQAPTPQYGLPRLRAQAPTDEPHSLRRPGGNARHPLPADRRTSVRDQDDSSSQRRVVPLIASAIVAERDMAVALSEVA